MKKSKIMISGLTLAFLSASAIAIPFVTSSCGLVSNVTTPIDIKQSDVDYLIKLSKSNITKSNDISISTAKQLLKNPTNLIQAKRLIVAGIDKDGTKNILPKMIGTIDINDNGEVIISPALGYSFAGEINGNIVLKDLNFPKQTSPIGIKNTSLKVNANNQVLSQSDIYQTESNIIDIYQPSPKSSSSNENNSNNFKIELPTNVAIDANGSLNVLLENSQELSGFGNVNNLELTWNLKNSVNGIKLTSNIIQGNNLAFDTTYKMNLDMNIKQKNINESLLTNPVQIQINYHIPPKVNQLIIPKVEFDQIFEIDSSSTNGNTIKVINIKENNITPDTIVKFPDFIYDQEGNLYKIEYDIARIFPNHPNKWYINVKNAILGAKFVDAYNTYNDKLVSQNGTFLMHPFPGIVNVEMSEGIRRIPKGFFARCINLKTVKFPTTLITIEQQAFHSCTSIEEIFIPKSVEEIVGNAFTSCTKLKTIKIERL